MTVELDKSDAFIALAGMVLLLWIIFVRGVQGK